MNEAALAGMVRLSHGYPYFIQLLGQATWGAMASSATRGAVTPETFERAGPAFEYQKRDYYRYRYRELEDLRLLPAARAVAEAFEGRAVLDAARLERAISAGINEAHPGVASVRRTLSDLGFIWGTSPDPGWEPGIPSLMDYVLEFAPRP